MTRTCTRLLIMGLLITGLLLIGTNRSNSLAAETDAEQILKETGIPGGLVAHVGCGDDRLTAELRLRCGG